MIRAKHWIKNTFVFFPLFFGGRFTELPYLQTTILAFISFCLAASSIYILNDLRDVKEDRLHPLKRNRPIAAGLIPVANAYVLSVLLLMASLVVAYGINQNTLLVISLYFVMNVFYTFYLKQIPIIDCVIIAIGFVMRIVGGGVAISIEITSWIILLTFILSLYLAFSKRRGELVNGNVGVGRKSIQEYNKSFLDTTISILAAIAIVAYILYTQDAEIIAKFHFKYYYMGSVFVVIGLLRHLQKTMVTETTESPTDFLYTDKVLLTTVALWGIFNFYVIYTK